jgi:TraC-like protein
MARRKNRAEILADIEDLKKQLAESEEREERRIGKLANKAGLLDLDISDEDLATAFAELAARFRQDGHGTAASQSAPRPAAQARANGGGA